MIRRLSPVTTGFSPCSRHNIVRLTVCRLGHTMEDRLLTLKTIGSKRDDNSTLYKMHSQRPYLLVKKQENTPPASCPSSKMRSWRTCAPSCQQLQADFTPPGLSAASLGVQQGWEGAGGEGGTGGHQVYLEGTDDI